MNFPGEFVDFFTLFEFGRNIIYCGMFSGYCSFIANVLVSAFDFNFLLYPLVVYTAQFK